jgi:hypothetical protein
MKRKKKEVKKIEKYILYALPILIIILIIIFIKMPKDCGSDTECFNEAAQKCKPSTLTLSSQGNIFEYKIYGESKEKCVVKIKILSLESSPELKEKFENKYMVCKIPKEEIKKSIGFSTLQKTTEYCTGPLKEALLEKVIEKLYSIITQNIGEIVLEAEDILTPVEK